MKKQVLTFLPVTILAATAANTFSMETTKYQLLNDPIEFNEENGRALIELNPSSFRQLTEQYNKQKEQIFSKLIKRNDLTKDSLVDIKITFPTCEEVKVTSLISNDMFSFGDITKINAKFDLRIQDLVNSFQIIHDSMYKFDYEKNDQKSMKRHLISIQEQTDKLLATIKDNEKKLAQKQKLEQLKQELEEFTKENNVK